MNFESLWESVCGLHIKLFIKRGELVAQPLPEKNANFQKHTHGGCDLCIGTKFLIGFAFETFISLKNCTIIIVTERAIG